MDALPKVMVKVCKVQKNVDSTVKDRIAQLVDLFGSLKDLHKKEVFTC